MLKKIIALGSLILFFSLKANCGIFELGERYFETIGSNRDISISVITAIEQDHQGFMWFGTQNGLLKYDGYNFQVFNYDKDNINTISGDYILSLLATQDGLIWIGTLNSGLSVYDAKTNQFRRYKHDENNDKSLSNNNVWSIQADVNGGIWLATANGLNYKAPNQENFEHFFYNKDEPSGLLSNRIYSLHFSDENTLWVGTGDGLNILKIAQMKFSIPFAEENGSSPFKDQIIARIFESSDKRIWLGTREHGATWIIPDKEYHSLPLDASADHHLSSPWVFAIAQVNENEIWLGTFGGGITVFDLATNKVKEYIRHSSSNNNSINLDDIGSMTTDASGLVWIGTWGGGLNRYNPKSTAFRSLHHDITDDKSISHANVLSLLSASDGRLWVGTGGNGVDIIDPEKGLVDGIRVTEDNSNGLKSGSIVTMAQSDAKTYWLGTSLSGLYKYNIDTKKIINYNKDDGLSDNSTHYILASDDVVWVATTNGLSRIKDNTITKMASMENINRPLSVAVFMLKQQQDKTLWIMTAEGLYALPDGGKYLIPIKHDNQRNDSISSNIIKSITLDPKDNLWVATENTLEKIVEWDGRVARFESLDKYIHGDISLLFDTLVFDQAGNGWNGFARFDATTGNVVELTKSDGVDIGGAWFGSFTKTKDHKILFGGLTGILVVDPIRYQSWDYEPPVRVTKIKVDNNMVFLGDEKLLTLSPDNKAISVEFSSLDYSVPEQNKYAYQLKGYDRDWIYVDSEYRSANYTNLDPKDYELVIRGSNRFGKWSSNVISLPIRQLPAWYQTIVFRLFLILLTISLIVVVYKIRLRQLNKQKQELETQVAKRTADIFMLSEIGRELTASLDLNYIVEQLYKSLDKVIDINVFLIGFVHKELNQLVIPLMVENGNKIDDWVLSLDDEEHPGVWCVNHSKEVLIRNNEDWEKYAAFSTLQNKSRKLMSTIIYQPLVINDNIVGCMSVQSVTQNTYDNREVDMIRTLSSYTAIAVANALGFTQLEKTNEQLKLAHSELEKVSLTDQLTGAYNRRFLSKVITQEISGLRRNFIDKGKEERNDFGFLLIDADHFKKVNDNYGHDAGDKILVQLVSIITKTCRDSDWVIRWGGEEFLVVARFTHRDELHKLAGRIKNNVNKHSFDIGNGKILVQSCSIGVTAFPFIKGEFDLLSWEQNINLADIALYIAKRNGRDAWVSLFEKNVESYDSFYKKVSENLKKSIDDGIVSIHSSISTQLDLSG